MKKTILLGLDKNGNQIQHRYRQEPIIPQEPKQETIEEVAEHYQELFNFFSQEHNLILTISEMDEIVHAANGFKSQFNKSKI